MVYTSSAEALAGGGNNHTGGIIDMLWLGGKALARWYIQALARWYIYKLSGSFVWRWK